MFVGAEAEKDRTATSARGESFLANTKIYDASPDSTTDSQPLSLMAEGLGLEKVGETPEHLDSNATACSPTGDSVENG